MTRTDCEPAGRALARSQRRPRVGHRSARRSARRISARHGKRSLLGRDRKRTVRHRFLQFELWILRSCMNRAGRTIGVKWLVSTFAAAIVLQAAAGGAATLSGVVTPPNA